MPNPSYPLSALKNATSIGNPWDKIEVKQGMMPMPPALQGLSSAIPAMRRILPAAETLGEVLPDFTPVGGEAMYNLGKIGNIMKSKSMVEDLPGMGWDMFKRYATKLK